MTSAPLPGATPVVPRLDESEESKPVATMGLSTAFDSFGATMRLAAMTASADEVEELSKTFKMARPSMEDIKRASPKAPPVVAPVTPTVATAPKARPEAVIENAPSKNGGMLIAIVVLVIVGLVFALLR
jgi:hypothetical protein